MRDTLDSLLSGITTLGRWSTIALLTAAIALPRISHAEEPAEASADHCQTPKECFDAGNTLLEQKDYIGAARLLEKALDEVIDPFQEGILLYNIANIYERSGDPDRAIPYFRSYLRKDIEALQIEARKRKGEQFEVPAAERVGQWVKALEVYSSGKKAHTQGHFLEAVALYNQALQMDVSDTARLALQRDIGYSYEMAGQRELAIKSYQLYLQQAGATVSDSGEIQGRITALSKKKEQAPEPVVPPVVVIPPVQNESASHSYLQRHPWSTIAGGVAVGLFGASAAFHFKAEGQRETLENTCGSTRAGCSRDDIDALAGDYKARSGFFWAGVGAAGVAGILFALEPFGNKNPPKTSYRVAPFGMGAVLEGDL